ncbi:MAG: hypothetical protein A4E25_00129 [Methanobacterium sp. PtaB.Bin024]|jgi:hypothetical protein|nr:MAG: hypothetical protein A4E25_00129 [Methanobacterium sp. PtaB.Bin024]
MKAAYGTFLEALLVIYCHDMVADVAAYKYNVTWSRTTPIVVSGVDDATSTYITGEMSHRMGMDVVGDPDNVRAFRYACSSAFSPIEYWVGAALFPVYDVNGTRIYDNSSFLGTVTMGMGYLLLSGSPVEIFESNGYIFIRVVGDNNNMLVIDPETGIVRDICVGGGVSGSYCYGDQQTELGHGFGQNLIDNRDMLNNTNGTGTGGSGQNEENDDAQDEVLGIVGSALISIGVAALPLLIAAGPVGWIAAIGLIGGGLLASTFAADLDKDPTSLSNWANFGLNVVSSFIPAGGVAGSVAGKTIVKTVTSKGVTKTLFEIPAKYEGTLIRMGQLNYASKGSSELGILATSQYIKKGSPEGVLRVGFGWTRKDAVKNVIRDETIEHGADWIIIDPHREDIDYIGHKAYNNINDYFKAI